MTTLQIIELNKNLIYKIAGKFYKEDIEDLYQVGVIGVLKAYRNYQTDGMTKFSTYAYEYIFGEMYNLVNSANHYKVSKEMISLYKKIEIARYTLAQHKMKIPNNEEIAEFLKIDLNIVEMATNIGKTISFNDENENSRNLSETIKDKESISMDEKLIIKESMEQLTEEEQEIIKYRYYYDLSQQEVARKLSLSQAKVSRYEKKSIDKMKAYNKVA